MIEMTTTVMTTVGAILFIADKKQNKSAPAVAGALFNM